MKRKRGFKIKKKSFQIIVLLIILLIGIFAIYAASVDKTKAWHSSSEIIVSFGTCKVTLQDAITNDYFKGVTPTNCLSTLPSVYHTANQILITVNSYTMTLQEAVNNNVFRIGATRSYTTGLPIGGHLGSDIEVTVNGVEKSLQDSIDAGELNSECTPDDTQIKDCDYLDTACRDYHDVTQTCQSDGYWDNPACDSYTNAAEGTSCGSVSGEWVRTEPFPYICIPAGCWNVDCDQSCDVSIGQSCTINKKCDGNGNCVEIANTYSCCSNCLCSGGSSCCIFNFECQAT